MKIEILAEAEKDIENGYFFMKNSLSILARILLIQFLPI